MTQVRMLTVVAFGIAVLGSRAAGQSPSSQSSSMPHMVTAASDLKWGPSSPALPPGTTSALLAGDPAKAGESFVIRVKFPDGYRIPPHWHPTDEHVTVLQGTFMMAMGEKFDEAALKTLTVGGYAHTTAKTPHYALAKGETIVQVHGVGPFTLTYVNPADDPRKKSSGM
jgi:quercetin dioxygenase-like cupin family protein